MDRMLLGAVAAVLLLIFSSSAPALPSATAQSGHAEPSSEQGRIAFASTRDGDAEIFVMNADGSGVRQITHNEVDDHSPDWAPDGRRIAFVRNVSEGNRDIYIVDTKTGRERSFTAVKGFYETAPAWSPNGRWIAFAIENNLQDGGDVVAVRVDRKAFRMISAQDENSTNVDPTWSPDGKELAVVESYEYSDLYVAPFCCQGYADRQLTNDTLEEMHPRWSPDGDRILFGRVVERNLIKHGLYTISPNGGVPTVVFEGPLDARPGSWSPTGDQIVFYAAPVLTPYDIYRINPDGTGLARLTDHPASDHHPDWGPPPS